MGGPPLDEMLEAEEAPSRPFAMVPGDDLGPPPLAREPRVLAWLPLILLVALSFALHRDALRLPWLMDDPLLLDAAAFESISGFFFSPESLRRVSANFFTPMFATSIAVDYLAFGLEPSTFYARQLLSLGLLAAGLYYVLLPRGRAAAWTAALLFSFSPAAAVCARLVMLRHYIEGGCFALLAVLLLQRAASRRGRGWLTAQAAGVAYLVAMLYKETYVPLGLAAPWLVSGAWAVRRSLCAPMLVALAIYVPWRLDMLGTLGGYGGDPSFLVDPGVWGASGVAVLGMLGGASRPFGSWTPEGMAAAVVLVLTAVRLGRGRARVGWAVLTALGLASLVPILPSLAAGEVADYRLVLHLAGIGAVAIGYGMVGAGESHWSGPRIATAAVAFATLFGLIARHPSIVEMFYTRMRCHIREVDYLWNARGEGQVLATQFSFLNRPAVARLRRELRGQETPLVCSAPFDFRDDADREEARYVHYSRALDAIVSCDEGFRTTRRLFVDTIDEGRFRVRLAVSDGLVECQLDGGTASGRYFLLQGDVPGLYESLAVPPTASYRFAVPPNPTYFRFAKVVGEVCILTPEWRVDLRLDSVLEWNG
ncbi:MAG: hypothetical protein AAF628_19745 [Planctomycetota bacterium]